MNFKTFYLTESLQTVYHALNLGQLRSISESPIIDDKYGRTAKTSYYTKPVIGDFYQQYNKSKLLFKANEFEIRKLSYRPDETYLYCVTDGKPVAVLVYKFLDKKVAGFQKYPMVGWIYTNKEHLKFGIQKKLHDFLVAYHGGILVDTTLSNAGFGFYKKWANDYFTYSFDNNDLKSKIEEVDWDNVMNNKNERYAILDHKLPKEVLE